MFQWKNLAEIAAHKDGQGGLGRFEGCLPDADACDFDAQKEDFCASRANFLSSVDAVCAGKDGRVFFVEFKDEIERYRLGNLLLQGRQDIDNPGVPSSSGDEAP